jgi:glutamate synthase (NADPH) large chain
VGRAGLDRLHRRQCIGAVLDRNGLRPSRYYVTDDDKCIMASEVGVLPVDPAASSAKGRLQPGRMFLVDFEQGRMIPTRRSSRVGRRASLPAVAGRAAHRARRPGPQKSPTASTRTRSCRACRRSATPVETMQFMLLPMVKELRDPLGSMGNDAALAVLSDKPRMLYDYFKQLFAQVTNPAIDSIREEVIMSLECYIGPGAEPAGVHARARHRLRMPHPILSNEELAALKHMNHRGWRTRDRHHLPGREARRAGCGGARPHLRRGRGGHRRRLQPDRALRPARSAPSACPSALLAVRHGAPPPDPAGHAHAHRPDARNGEAREVHHCLLVGYGADAINPYLAFEALWQARARRPWRTRRTSSDDDVVYAYRKAWPRACSR